MMNKSELTKGIVLSGSFFLIFFIMWSPLFPGPDDTKVNAFHAADNLFNSISKGSAYFMDVMEEKNQAFIGKSVEATLELDNPKHAGMAVTMLREHQAEVEQDGAGVAIQGDLGEIVQAAIADSSDMFANDGRTVADRYGYGEEEARRLMYVWYSVLQGLENAMNEQQHFADAKHVAEVISKSVEVGYNFYGIEAESAGSKAGILTFSLVFYVVYTLWWGMAILYLFEGIGLKMTAGKKKEV
jgi:hypothetical protein